MSTTTMSTHAINELMNKTGFGFLRLPFDENKGPDEAELQEVNDLVDAFMEKGGTFFDTCYTYMEGHSEECIRKCVVERKPRDSFRLVEKLPGYECHCYEDCEKYFREEIERCGTDKFDVYMLHWLNGENYRIAQQVDQFRFLRWVKEQGYAERIGFSFHDRASLLDEILTAHPEVDVVLIQLNYLDWESEGIESRKCYQTCLRHGKQVFVMEPVKGGTLANLPQQASQLLRQVHPDWSDADWALKFVQSLPGVEVCLSGMNDIAQIEANLKDVEPLNDEELALLSRVCGIIGSNTAVPCTGCRYCVDHCPCGIPIPDYFKMYNEIRRDPEEGWKIRPAYAELAGNGNRAGDCVSCHNCEEHCPQNIKIAAEMKNVADALE
ncbi:MAG: aldo/keto reductase [Anaerovoracaceae bacterium]